LSQKELSRVKLAYLSQETHDSSSIHSRLQRFLFEERHAALHISERLLFIFVLLRTPKRRGAALNRRATFHFA
jgi:hypothetical protein